jgi:hypothetical protein
MPKGTRDWAGGDADYSTPHTMWIQNVKIENYSPATSYTYTDTSGTINSVKAIGGSLMSAAGSARYQNGPPEPPVEVVSAIEATSVLVAIPPPHETPTEAPVPQMVPSAMLDVETLTSSSTPTVTSSNSVPMSSSTTFRATTNATSTSSLSKTSTSTALQNSTSTAKAPGKSDAGRYTPQFLMLSGLLGMVALFAML